MNAPSYWVLNPLHKTFSKIPKKRKGLVNVKYCHPDPLYVEEDEFVLSELAWIPRRVSYLPKMIEKIRRRLSFANRHK
jgi:hypothetical protein|tara:strand:- start:5074 stop:5307 length:234 start_codon:yes stop_codon:yes gene_type:complete